MSSVLYTFEIPDPARPILYDEELSFGPSGELIPFIPAPLDLDTISGRVIDQVSMIVGTYGMGGPGFFGLRFGSDWLVISIWSAATWIFVDDKVVCDTYSEQYGRSLPWIYSGNDTLTPHLVGTTILSLVIEKHSLKIQFSNGSVLAIDAASSRRPIHEGNKKPREFLPDDDLRRAVFLAPTAEIWV